MPNLSTITKINMVANTKTSFMKLFPVLFGFYIMGFCDVVGIATNYVQKDFSLSDTVAGFLPTMVFFWFLLLSVPAAVIMNKLGRKKTVLLSMVITIPGMLIPSFIYTPTSCMIAFALLGIGNTILQVSLNPLLSNVVSGEALTSSLTSGQVIKAVSSFCGPFIAAFAMSSLGKWQYIFPIFAAITLLSILWLACTPIQENEKPVRPSVSRTFVLLKDTDILLLFLGIVFVVGIDVGMNTVTPKLMMERCNHTVQDASLGSGVYFAFRTLGGFIGTMLLVHMSEKRYFRIHILIALTAVLVLFFAAGEYFILAIVGMVGYGCSSIFAIVYSMTIKAHSNKVNEISGLMISGVFGGALIPPLMGMTTDAIGSGTGSLLVITIGILYLVYCAFWLKVK